MRIVSPYLHNSSHRALVAHARASHSVHASLPKYGGGHFCRVLIHVNSSQTGFTYLAIELCSIETGFYQESKMDLLTVLVILALFVTIVVAGMGVYSMTQGVDKADRQVNLARTGTVIISLWILVFTCYLLYK